jgi:hypothetical protein
VQIDAAAAAAAAALSEAAAALAAADTATAAEAAKVQQQGEARWKEATEQLAALQKQLQVQFCCRCQLHLCVVVLAPGLCRHC